VIVAAAEAGSYEERTCLRCFEGRGTTRSVARGWTASGARLPLGSWSTSTLSLSAVHTSAGSDQLRAGAPAMGLRFFYAGRGGAREAGGRSTNLHTPSKNPRLVSRRKHTSLTFLVNESSRVLRFFAQHLNLVTVVVTIRRRSCCRVAS